MGRWLDRLKQAENFSQTPGNETPKTPKTPPQIVSGVLGVPPGAVSQFFSDDRIAPEPQTIAKPIDLAALSPEDQIAAFDERAGILEYDEGLPRDEAERLAREQTRHLLH